ncbi:FHA domain-containing protein [Corynebacterium sp. HMSC04H06]|uniref:FHA domain-containing protein FhaB/FipA n=1 Tax=Corynebacterium sp. HMSC04H06 TaxID=1581050 RepID=UPI0008A50268|nr:FHA domain-containing protein [Corynebacterium sp. HMSC04H06]OFS23722.1 FHA domain-containing protein [Corynebacterium sp. HMSC04H06]
MDSFVLLALRIGLLVLLWLFILVALNAMRLDTNKAARTGTTTAGPVAAARRKDRKEKPRHITVAEGPLQGSHMALGTLEDISLGRAQDCDFVLGDDFASSHHARLFRRGSQWFVEDLESRNGTFVAGTRIDQAERIEVGTDIKMGRTIVRLVA